MQSNSCSPPTKIQRLESPNIRLLVLSTSFAVEVYTTLSSFEIQMATKSAHLYIPGSPPKAAVPPDETSLRKKMQFAFEAAGVVWPRTKQHHFCVTICEISTPQAKPTIPPLPSTKRIWS